MFETGPTPERPFNTLVVRGAVEASYRKIHLYDSFGYRESDRLSAGAPEPVLVDVGGRAGGADDLLRPALPGAGPALVDRGAELLVVPAAWVAGERKVDHWRTLVRARAIENTVFVAAAGQPAPRYSGHSMVVDPLGDVLAEAGDDATTLRVELDPAALDAGPPDQPLAGQPASVTFLVVPSSAPRRRAERPPSRGVQLLGRAGSRLGPLAGSAAGPGAPVAAWWLLVLAGAGRAGRGDGPGRAGLAGRCRRGRGGRGVRLGAGRAHRRPAGGVRRPWPWRWASRCW